MDKYPVEPDVLRFKLAKLMPYFTTAIYRLKPVKVKGIGTFGVDKRWRWMFDEEVPFTQEEQVTVLFHEINHLLRNHHARQGDRQVKRWNYGTDSEINDWFPAGMSVPANILLPSQFGLPDGELAEWYYDHIDQADAHQRTDASALCPGSGPCATDPDNCDSEDKQPVLDKDFTVLERGKVHVPTCGGGSGEGDDGEEDGDGGVNEVEAEAIRREVATKIGEAASLGRGNVPAGMARWADQLLNPKVHWSKLLRRDARRYGIIIAGQTDQTYNRPARREVDPFILPKRIAHKTTVAFYIDTSGSMSDEDVAQGIAEVKGALRTGMAQLFVSFVDAEVYKAAHVTTAAEVKKLRPEGGGGTDMRLCFEHYKTLRPKPNLIVVLTDGQTPWPAEAPNGVHTIVVVTTQQGTCPPWAREIRTEGE